MANSRVAATGFPEFIDQDGTAYFGELEEAFLQGVVRINSQEEKKDLIARKPPTLDIFPSWPIKVNSQLSGESTGSGSAVQNTIFGLSEQSGDQKKQQKVLLQEMDVVASSTAAATNPSHKSQSKRSSSEKDCKPPDAKTLRRLAQNREAARKSRLRKKAYVQQLENSRFKLMQIEQDLQRARSQGVFLGGGSSAGGTVSSGASIFDAEYSRWLDESSKRVLDLRASLQSHLSDDDLRLIVDENLSHYDELFRLRAAAAGADVFHLITGMWTTPAERCFLWMGGFRPSEMLKMLMGHLDPVTEQQMMGICSLQQSSQQAEEALSQGLDQLHHSLADTIAFTDAGAGGNDYMRHMAVALSKLSNLEGFVRQADNLRQQSLHQMRRILTVRQAARCFLAMEDYYTRLRSLSSLWASRPPENYVSMESSCPWISEMQIAHQPLPSQQFSAF